MGGLRDILERSETVAVVGISRDYEKPGGHVPVMLQRRGFRIIPVNPNLEEILGEKAYPSLLEIPEPVDVVEVFRPSEEAPELARQAVAIGAKTLWLQLGLQSEEARLIAEEAGLTYVEDHCMGVESAKYHIRKRAARGEAAGTP